MMWRLNAGVLIPLLVIGGAALTRASVSDDATLAAVRVTHYLKPQPIPSVKPVKSAERNGGRITVVVRATGTNHSAALTNARLGAIREAVRSLAAGQKLDRGERKSLESKINALSALLTARLDALGAQFTELKASEEGKEAEATVALGVSEANLKHLALIASSPRAVVLQLDDRVDGTSQDDGVSEAAIASTLLREGVHVFPADASTTSGEQNGDAAERTASGLLAGWIADVRMRSDYSQNNAGIISYTARATFRLRNARTGELEAAVTTDTARGFALNKPQAAEKARRACAEQLSERLTARLRDSGRVTVTLELPTSDAGLIETVTKTVRSEPTMHLEQIRRLPASTQVTVSTSTGVAALIALLHTAEPHLVLDDVPLFQESNSDQR